MFHQIYHSIKDLDNKESDFKFADKNFRKCLECYQVLSRTYRDKLQTL